jgi:hypothetical protein
MQTPRIQAALGEVKTEGAEPNAAVKAEPHESSRSVTRTTSDEASAVPVLGMHAASRTLDGGRWPRGAERASTCDDRYVFELLFE